MTYHFHCCCNNVTCCTWQSYMKWQKATPGSLSDDAFLRCKGLRQWQRGFLHTHTHRYLTRLMWNLSSNWKKAHKNSSLPEINTSVPISAAKIKHYYEYSKHLNIYNVAKCVVGNKKLFDIVESWLQMRSDDEK